VRFFNYHAWRKPAVKAESSASAKIESYAVVATTMAEIPVAFGKALTTDRVRIQLSEEDKATLQQALIIETDPTEAAELETHPDGDKPKPSGAVFSPDPPAAPADEGYCII
jgi:hypothetical protein